MGNQHIGWGASMAIAGLPLRPDCPVHRNRLEAGSLFLLRPGQWHRYRPAPETGWSEFWIAFNGRIAENIFSQDYFPTDKPVMDIGYSEETIRMFVQAVELATEMPHAYQPRLAAHIMHILALALNARQTGNSNDEKMVQRIRCALTENLERNIRMEEVAESLNISYTIFRRTFKARTGLAPGQYHLQLRISRAKDLLAGTDLPVSRIAYQLGFESPYYFSRIFKKKTESSPRRWRELSSPKQA